VGGAVALAAAFSLIPDARAVLGSEAMPSEVIFPKQQLPLSFSHERHLAREKMDCAYCHEDAPDSTKSSDNNIPKEETCATCHEIERDKPNKEVLKGEPGAKCSLCHPGWDPSASKEPPRVVVPAPNLKFNHKVHVDRKIRCQTCHGDLLKEKVGLATRAQLPRMPLCLECHDGKTASAKCTTCHLSEPGGQVKTDYPEGTLVPSGALRGDAHDLRFRRDHARVAANDEKYCASCHERSFCTECHNNTQKPMDIHGGDYVNQHTVDARRNDPDCGACHRRQTFCTGCHTRSGVNTDSRTSEFDTQSLAADEQNGWMYNRLFHKRGWFTSFRANERLPEHHSFQAQKNIRTCASCHRESFCANSDCHGAGGAVNPHPSGWRTSEKCRTLRAKAGRMCLKCHVNPDNALCD
jgi:hypothetical protein